MTQKAALLQLNIVMCIGEMFKMIFYNKINEK